MCLFCLLLDGERWVYTVGSWTVNVRLFCRVLDGEFWVLSCLVLDAKLRSRVFNGCGVISVCLGELVSDCMFSFWRPQV